MCVIRYCFEHKQTYILVRENGRTGRRGEEEEESGGGDGGVPGMADGVVDHAEETPGHRRRWPVLDLRAQGPALQVPGRVQAIQRTTLNSQRALRVPTSEEENRPSRCSLSQELRR